MGSTGRHAMSAPWRTRLARVWDLRRLPSRLDVTAAVAASVAVTAMIAAVVARNGPAPANASPGASAPDAVAVVTANAVPAISEQASALAQRTAVSLAPTAADRRDCPATATACVDLTRHITWLQAQGKITFGPVQMEPGQPGSQHQTPRGTFQVAWKAGPAYRSNIYHEPMPWATFFAPGGIAFHGGSLTTWSHGCVHLTDADARYYNEHLPVGAQVVVF